MTKLKLKVWIALLATCYDYALLQSNNEYLAKLIKSTKKECEIKLLEEYKND